jgi:hypothetical protein
MRAALLPALAIAAATANVCCLQVAGVKDVTFTAEDGGERDAVTAADGGNAEAQTPGPDAPTLPIENCPSCSNAACCSPKHCMAGTCCADRAGPCAAASDCCNGQCDVDAGRCTGACLETGSSPCVVDTDCCTGTCSSDGQCVAACGRPGAGCTSDHECCFGLGCTSSEAGVCMMF